MNEQMLKITDTEMADRAAESGWCINTLARNCGVSVSTLERSFHETKGQCPRDWMLKERMHRARASLEAGRNVQQTAGDLGFKNQHHFSLVFKKFHDYCPKEHKARMEALKKIEDGKLKMAQNGNPKSKVQSPEFAKRGTRDAGRGTRDTTMMPGRKSRFDEFKYICDEYRYILVLASD